MHILEVAFTRSFGGLELMVTTFAQWFTGHGHRVSVVTVDGSPLYRALHDRGIAVTGLTPLLKYCIRARWT